MSWRVLILLVIPLYFLSLAVKAIKSGRIQSAWRGKTDTFFRHSDPWMFWFLTATLIGISVIISFCIIIASAAAVKP
ncbi:MAG: hypothetical protein J0L73_03355 [Verrucomicrobia bacterium]|nr:hypothetical protein [Verrucomicrobiota bacterium]